MKPHNELGGGVTPELDTFLMLVGLAAAARPVEEAHTAVEQVCAGVST